MACLGGLPVSRRQVMATDADLSLSACRPSRAWSNDHWHTLHAGARDRQLGEQGIWSTGHGDGCRPFALGVLPESRRPVMATDVDLSLSVRRPSRAWSNGQLLVVEGCSRSVHRSFDARSALSLKYASQKHGYACMHTHMCTQTQPISQVKAW